MDFSDRQTRQRLLGILLVNLACLTWATNMILGRWLRGDIGPLALAAARFSLATVFFAVLLSRRPPEERRPGADRPLLIWMALTGVVAFAPSLYLGLRFTTAVNAALINGLAPLITGLIAALLIGEAMSRRQVAGAVAGLAGVTILISGGRLVIWRQLSINVGDLITLGSVVLWGLYSVLGRQVMRRRSALSATALSVFLGLPLLLFAAPWEAQVIPLRITAPLILGVAYIGCVPTVVGFLAWNAGVRRLGAAGAMVFYNTLPLYGVLLGSVLLAEPLGLAHLAGGVLIVGGGVWAARGR
jgi:drug/metabolite transporter (DMT)-like permease